ncbi:craniofacial development protein 2-like [Plakobranchus ocellatus]|uniref:Craniofacial development protein 2-like n=1 Tax=Plakobranchus ocellatus TaxID=259542 RepID=A0AAV3ZDN8_9GAST|nr:craniofacial development protein 2-like [Plakobranchus ocellatus]
MLSGPDVEVETFYEGIEETKGYLKYQDIIVVMGDFNAKVGNERVEDVVGPSGKGTVNDHGSRLIEWCQILGTIIILGDSGLGRAPVIEQNRLYSHSETIPKRCQNIEITVGSRP